VVSGPPGAGKRTLLAKAQESLAASTPKGCPGLAFKEVGIAADLFDGVREELEVGRRVVLLGLGSAMFPEVLERFGAVASVYLLNITAPTVVLEERRQTARQEKRRRVEADAASAAEDSEPSGAHVIAVLNEASVDEGAARVVAALTDTMKCTLWLVPPATSRCDVVARAEIERLSRSNGVRPFPPHITLSPSFHCGQARAVELTRLVAAALSPISMHFVGVSHSCAFFKAIALTAEASEALVHASQAAKRIVGTEKAFDPHLSLLYGDLSEDARCKITEELSTSLQLQSFDHIAKDVVCVNTLGNSYHCWTEVCRFPVHGT